MLSIDRLTSRIKEAMKAAMNGKRSNSSHSVIIETDFKHKPEKENNVETPMLAGAQEVMLMDEVQNNFRIRDEIEAAIRDSCCNDHRCQIILPNTLTSRVSDDIIRMSLSEPCGVQGCVIYITVQDKGKNYPLTAVYGSSYVPPTFEIHLTLKEDNRGWNRLHKAYLMVKGCILNSKWKEAPKIVRPSYQLEKRKLYKQLEGAENVHKSLNHV